MVWFSGTILFMCLLGLNSISSSLISWFHASLLAVAICALVKKIFSVMPEHIVCFCPGYTMVFLCFPHTCIYIPHQVHGHCDQPSSYALLDHNYIVFTLCTCLG